MIAIPCCVEVIWHIEAPIDPIWAAIRTWEQWPLWWNAVANVVVIHSGDPQGIGAVFEAQWRLPLPIKITTQSCVTQVKPPHLFEHISQEGVISIAQWKLEPQDWGTKVCFNWKIEMADPWAETLLYAFPQILLEEILFNCLKAGGQGLAKFLGVPFRGMEKCGKLP
jgi:hypothetical protein